MMLNIGSSIYDVSILISFFFISSKHGVNINGINTFISSYYEKDEKIKKEEIPLIKKCALEWINYLINEKKISTSLIEVFETKFKLINEIL